LPGKGELVGRLAMAVEPPGAGQHDELGMREAQRGECCSDATLPAQRGMPQQKSGTVTRLERRQGCVSLANGIRLCQPS
jgi:hypothetical protein